MKREISEEFYEELRALTRELVIWFDAHGIKANEGWKAIEVMNAVSAGILMLDLGFSAQRANQELANQFQMMADHCKDTPSLSQH
jgi:hypothetical protein